MINALFIKDQDCEILGAPAAAASDAERYGIDARDPNLDRILHLALMLQESGPVMGGKNNGSAVVNELLELKGISVAAVRGTMPALAHLKRE